MIINEECKKSLWEMFRETGRPINEESFKEWLKEINIKG